MFKAGQVTSITMQHEVLNEVGLLYHLQYLGRLNYSLSLRLFPLGFTDYYLHDFQDGQGKDHSYFFRLFASSCVYMFTVTIVMLTCLNEFFQHYTHTFVACNTAIGSRGVFCHICKLKPCWFMSHWSILHRNINEDRWGLFYFIWCDSVVLKHWRIWLALAEIRVNFPYVSFVSRLSAVTWSRSRWMLKWASCVEAAWFLKDAKSWV